VPKRNRCPPSPAGETAAKSFLSTLTKPCSASIGKNHATDFYRDEDFHKTSFVPVNTLLEPNNVIPSWEFGGEEKKEVSNTMRKLRQKYDSIHKTVLSKEKELQALRVSGHCTHFCAEATRSAQIR
jgi:hypothetical protein